MRISFDVEALSACTLPAHVRLAGAGELSMAAFGILIRDVGLVYSRLY
jgi:hypothetical protein